MKFRGGFAIAWLLSAAAPAANTLYHVRLSNRPSVFIH